VLRSVSVPTNLPEMEIVEKTATVDGSIPEDKEGLFSSSGIADSLRSEPADTEGHNPQQPQAKSRSSSPPSSWRRHQVVKSQEQQQHRNAAMAKLEEFFLGEVSIFDPGSEASPVSVLEFEKNSENEVAKTAQPTPKSIPTSPKRNMFGQIMEEEPKPLQISAVEPTTVEESSSPYSSSSSFVEPDNNQKPDAKESQEPSRDFAMLSQGGRANSLPLDCMLSSQSSRSSFKALTRKPSLKKISSNGRFPRERSDDDSLKRSVSFSNLQIREYDVALSDHPSCSFGPPVQLSWDYREKLVVPVESYEEAREPRRDFQDLVLSYYDRRFMLIKQAGYSKREVKQAVQEAERVKRERMVTDMFGTPFDETMEHVIDQIKTFFKRQEEVTCVN
jgi:hypothetical protein